MHINTTNRSATTEQITVLLQATFHRYLVFRDKFHTKQFIPTMFNDKHPSTPQFPAWDIDEANGQLRSYRNGT